MCWVSIIWFELLKLSLGSNWWYRILKHILWKHHQWDTSRRNLLVEPSATIRALRTFLPALAHCLERLDHGQISLADTWLDLATTELIVLTESKTTMTSSQYYYFLLCHFFSYDSFFTTRPTQLTQYRNKFPAGLTPGNGATILRLPGSSLALVDSSISLDETCKSGNSSRASLASLFAESSWNTAMHQRLDTPSVTNGIFWPFFRITHSFPSAAAPSCFTMPLHCKSALPSPRLFGLKWLR